MRDTSRQSDSEKSSILYYEVSNNMTCQYEGQQILKFKDPIGEISINRSRTKSIIDDDGRSWTVTLIKYHC